MMLHSEEDEDNFYVLRDFAPCRVCGEPTNLLSKMHLQVMCQRCVDDAGSAIHRYIARQLEQQWRSHGD